MSEYLSNVFEELQVVLERRRLPAILSQAQVEQVLSEHAALVEKANALVRENNDLRAQLAGHCEQIAAQSELLGRCSEREPAV